MRNEEFVKLAAEKMLEALENGCAPWTRPWKAGSIEAMEISGATRKPYRGINQLMLSIYNPTGEYNNTSGADFDPRWYTFKGAQAVCAQVKKGAKGVPVVFASSYDYKTGEIDDDGDNKTRRGWYEKISHVFHASCIEGLDIYAQPKKEILTEHGVNELAENIVKNYISRSGPVLNNRNQSIACYFPGSDSVLMPLKGQFFELSSYYAVLLHELGHSTGHEKRLNRFKRYQYGMEELIAELTSHFLSKLYGIEHDPSNHVSYISVWADMIKADPQTIILASKEANRAMNLILEGFEEEKREPAEAA